MTAQIKEFTELGQKVTVEIAPKAAKPTGLIRISAVP